MLPLAHRPASSQPLSHSSNLCVCLCECACELWLVCYEFVLCLSVHLCVWVGGDKACALAFEINQEWFEDHSASQRKIGGLRERGKKENVGR